MRNIDKRLREIRPSLRLVAPLTYYISWGFAVFNILAGLSLVNFPQTKFLIVGAVDLRVWAALFIFLGTSFTYSLVMNDWRTVRILHLGGVVIKTAWLMELIARAVVGRSFILVFIWLLLLYLQAVTFRYFTPVENRDVR